RLDCLPGRRELDRYLNSQVGWCEALLVIARLNGDHRLDTSNALSDCVVRLGLSGYEDCAFMHRKRGVRLKLKLAVARRGIFFIGEADACRRTERQCRRNKIIECRAMPVNVISVTDFHLHSNIKLITRSYS